MTAYNRSTSALSIDYAAQIKDRLSMFDVVYKYIPNLKVTRSGDILCPFHSEKTPSFHLWDDHYKCFGCPAHGDIISFVEQLHGLNFEQALSKLNDDFGLMLPINRKPTLREAAEAHRNYLERIKQRQAKETNIAKLMCKFRAACDELKRLRQNYLKYKPLSGCSELHALFTEALQNIDYYDYLTTDLSEQISQLEHSGTT
jgi:DNA primase